MTNVTRLARSNGGFLRYTLLEVECLVVRIEDHLLAFAHIGPGEHHPAVRLSKGRSRLYAAGLSTIGVSR